MRRIEREISSVGEIKEQGVSAIDGPGVGGGNYKKDEKPILNYKDIKFQSQYLLWNIIQYSIQKIKNANIIVNK